MRTWVVASAFAVIVAGSSFYAVVGSPVAKVGPKADAPVDKARLFSAPKNIPHVPVEDLIATKLAIQPVDRRRCRRRRNLRRLKRCRPTPSRSRKSRLPWLADCRRRASSAGGRGWTGWDVARSPPAVVRAPDGRPVSHLAATLKVRIEPIRAVSQCKCLMRTEWHSSRGRHSN